MSARAARLHFLTGFLGVACRPARETRCSESIFRARANRETLFWVTVRCVRAFLKKNPGFLTDIHTRAAFLNKKSKTSGLRFLMQRFLKCPQLTVGTGHEHLTHPSIYASLRVRQFK